MPLEEQYGVIVTGQLEVWLGEPQQTYNGIVGVEAHTAMD